jgi:hypothetical protein
VVHHIVPEGSKVDVRTSGRIMRRLVRASKEVRRSDTSVGAVVLRVYRGLLKVPHQVKARFPHLEYLRITSLDKDTFGIILTGKRTVGKAMTQVLQRERTKDTASSIRKRIDARAARWREKHGAIDLVPKNYKPGDRIGALYIQDPMSKKALAFNPDQFASLMGASMTVSGRKI